MAGKFPILFDILTFQDILIFSSTVSLTLIPRMASFSRKIDEKSKHLILLNINKRSSIVHDIHHIVDPTIHEPPTPLVNLII